MRDPTWPAMENENEIDILTSRHNLQRILKDQHMHLPPNYLVVDTETTAKSPELGVIWQIGMYPVIDGQPAAGLDGDSLLLQYPVDDLKKARFEIENRCVKRGLPATEYPILEAEFLKTIADKGMDPKTAFEITMGVIKYYKDNKWPIVGQNICKFDILWFDWAAKDFGFVNELNGCTILDTGMLIKAGILGERIDNEELFLNFYFRVAERRAKGVFYAIDRFCFPYWNLKARFGLDRDKAHDAAYDCRVTSKVLECMVEDIINSESITQ